MSRRTAQGYGYRGEDHTGNSVVGRLELSPDQLTQWVRRRFRRGWRWAELRRDGCNDVVGAIDDGSLIGKRTWWTE